MGINTSGKRVFIGTGSRRRAGFLDELRGVCVLLMVIYHAAYDIIYIFGWDIPLFHWKAVRLAQPIVAGIFIFIAGICCRFSRSNVKRGVIVLAIGAAISAYTMFFMPGQVIYFGILHFLGTAMILFGLLRGGLDVFVPVMGILLCTALYLFTFGVSAGYLGFPWHPLILLPHSWAVNPALIPLGFSAAGADHFPILPWIFVFLAGSYIGIAFARQEVPEFFYRSRSRFLSAVGRRAIYVYVLHQPVTYGLLYGLFWVIGSV